MKRIIILILFIMIPILIYVSTFTVNQKEYVIVTQFGKPMKIIKTPGLYFKLPGFLQTVNRLDKRSDIFKTQSIQLLLGDKNPIILNCYVCWRIYEPLLFFQSLITKDIAKQKLNDMVSSQLGSTLSDYTIDNIINTNIDKLRLQEIEQKITADSNEMARDKYGIEIVSIGIRRINYPSIVANSVYERMRAEREKEAKKYRAQGQEEAAKIMAKTDKEVSRIQSEAYKQAEIIKGKGDEESIKIYADSYGQDPELFKFLKSLETLRDVLDKKGTLILSTDSELLNYLKHQDHAFEKKSTE